MLLQRKAKEIFEQMLKPDFYYQNILQININQLKSLKVEAIICDLDNTLLNWESNKISPEVKRWLFEAEKAGISIFILSNALTSRVNQATEELDFPVIARAFKPSKKYFEVAMDILAVEKNRVAVIGDQLFTDVLGANRLGLISILLDPLSEKDFVGTKLIRLVEKKLKKCLELK
ncbi:YqeG family HAD IIIA-type phosphatase [Fuchsiella alkaliacetigena]|uniref:YqeG family HAD IIIA-type phosphatase n=1 Tax=Fuchsiella alkaliacetigena TaxID=957042 RepID=UPI00200A864C|nr:YqeG family HAD IIIA-type phosphatase [Fuchsiella alkaliacetigena]MCK8825099.1 YqeG family HAD IIIA-type phosphatase [Fuchsiella alkaliacetigena]